MFYRQPVGVSMKVGDLVATTSPPSGIDGFGIVLSKPFVHEQIECVAVQWFGWNYQENFATEFLKVISKKEK